MKTTVTIFLLLTIIFFSGFVSNRIPGKPKYLKLEIPKGWPAPSKNVFANNPLTEEGFQLGRKLFYDTRLSKDSTISCASCHQQFAAFTTYDHDFGHGVANTHTTRNVPGIFNVAWMHEMQWDGGVNHLEVQPLVPITAKNEMAETLENVLRKLNGDTAYKRMFRAAFGDAGISSQRLLKALAQFTGSIISCNSKYDKFKRGEEKFTVSEQYGYGIFKAKCNACHTEPLFTDNAFRNNGLDINTTLNDKGRMAVTRTSSDSLKFKVPSLRNVEFTAPYMHDARMYTLSQVIDHYRGKLNVEQPTLDSLLKNRIPISEQEKVDLISFLYTLTDKKLLQDKRFGPPD